jgi:uncharacterized membrane protein
MKVALVTSVALNLLILGAIGGSLWAFRHHRPWLAYAMNVHLLGFAATLPQERRAAIWEATREARRAMRPFRHEVREARAEARALLAAEPFDKEKFAQAQARLLDAEMRVRREAHKLYVDVASLMTPQERQAFTQWQPRREEMRRRWWRRMRLDDEDDSARPKSEQPPK